MVAEAQHCPKSTFDFEELMSNMEGASFIFEDKFISPIQETLFINFV